MTLIDLSINVNTRVAGGAVREHGAGSGETIGIFVKDNRAFVLNKLDIHI